MLTDHHRIALLTDGYSTPFLAKTAISLIRYRESDVAVLIDREFAGQSTTEVFGVGQVPVVADWPGSGTCDAVYIGIAPPGGSLPPAWRGLLEQAIREGVDIVSGLHDFLTEDEGLVSLASTSGARLIDVRKNRWKKTATAEPFAAGVTRIHSVGHDCSVGKMVTTLEIQRGLQAEGWRAGFVATGQTGIMISGQGVPADCVVSDFLNGAIEYQVRQQEPDHDFLLVEGQGSISHPAFSAVTAGLLHGCAPDGLVFCYEAGRQQVKGFGEIAIPPLRQQMDALLQMAALRHPARMIGISINTRTLSASESRDEIRRAEDQFQLPACDVYREGAGPLVEACLALRKEIQRHESATV